MTSYFVKVINTVLKRINTVLLQNNHIYFISMRISALTHLGMDKSTYFSFGTPKHQDRLGWLTM